MVGKLDRPEDNGCGFSAGQSKPACTTDSINIIFAAEEPKIIALLSLDINKGGVWIVGNEANLGGPEIPASLYAYQFKKYWDLIKRLDPTAKIAHSGLLYHPFAYSTANPRNPVTYLSTFLQDQALEGIKPDIYNIHFYPGNTIDEASFEASKNKAIEFSTFVKSIVDPNNPTKPIWVTEFGVHPANASAAFPPPALTNRYMDIMVDYFLTDTQYQRWFWFVSYAVEPFWQPTALTVDRLSLTDVGKHYRKLAIDNGEDLPPVSIAPHSLVGHWNMDDNPFAGVGAIKDKSIYKSNGTAQNVEQSDIVKDAGMGKSASFNGTNSSITMPYSESTNPEQAITLSAWIYPTAAQKGQIISKNGPYRLTFHSFRRVEFGLYAGGSGDAYFANTILPLDQWTHVAATYDGAKMAVYINGVEDTTLALSRTPPRTGAKTGTIVKLGSEVVIGSGISGLEQYFKGNIDDVRIYNYALSAEEIRNLVGLPNTSPVPTPIPTVTPTPIPTPTPTPTVTPTPVTRHTISGYVYKDDNGNNIREDGEGLIGATVTIANSNGTRVGSLNTSPEGYYILRNLADSNYTVTLTKPDPLPSGRTLSSRTVSASLRGADLTKDFRLVPSVPTPNLLVNGDFETSPTTTPVASWLCEGAVSGTCQLDRAEKRPGSTGNHSVKVTNIGGQWGWQITRRSIPAQAGDKFCLSAWVKKQKVNDATFIAIQEVQNDWESVGLGASDTTAWQLVRGTLTRPSSWDTAIIQVYLRSWSNSSAWFDDVSLTRGACQ